MAETINFTQEQPLVFRDHYERVKNDLELDPNRTDLNLNYVINRSPEVQEWTAGICQAIAGYEGLHASPDETGWHVTGALLVPNINDADPNYQARRAQFTGNFKAKIRESNIDKIELTLLWPEAESDGIIAFIDDNPDWRKLMGLAADEAEKVFPNFVRPDEPGKDAHVTLAYGEARTQEQQDAIQQMLDDLRRSGQYPEKITFTIDRISLVDQISDPEKGFYIQSGPNGDAEDVVLTS